MKHTKCQNTRIAYVYRSLFLDSCLKDLTSCKFIVILSHEATSRTPLASIPMKER